MHRRMHCQPIEVAIGKERHSSALLCLLTKSLDADSRRSASPLLLRPYQDAKLSGSGTVSLTISHRSEWQILLSQRVCLIVPEYDDVVGLECNDEVPAIASDRSFTRAYRI
jgi:hypothetical protein